MDHGVDSELREVGDGPLADLRVLDLGQGVAGPYCAKLLADQGADVIKLEPPRGDWGRTLGHPAPGSGLSGTFIAINRGKRSICLDLGEQRGREIARRLALSCSVVVESFRPGVTERLGLGYEDLRAHRSDMIYCSVTGFGGSGPNVAAPASDSMMQAYGGLMSITGPQGGEPLRVGTVASDMLAGGNAFSAVLLALRRRERRGGGGRIEVNLLDSLLAFQSTNIVEYLITGHVPVPKGNRHPLIGASGVARTQDGWMAIGVFDHYWEAFCEILDDDGVQDARFATGPERQKNQGALWDALDRVFATRTSEEWVGLLRPVGIVCSPVQDYAALTADPQVHHNGMLGRLPDGTPSVEPPFRVDGVASWHVSAPPQLGEHTYEVLAGDLGLSADEIDTVLASASER